MPEVYECIVCRGIIDPAVDPFISSMIPERPESRLAWVMRRHAGCAMPMTVTQALGTLTILPGSGG